jgi:hypothetical protein
MHGAACMTSFQFSYLLQFDYMSGRPHKNGFTLIDPGRVAYEQGFEDDILLVGWAGIWFVPLASKASHLPLRRIQIYSSYHMVSDSVRNPSLRFANLCDFPHLTIWT